METAAVRFGRTPWGIHTVIQNMAIIKIHS